MLKGKPQKRPTAKALLQTKLLKGRIEHIQSSFVFSIQIIFSRIWSDFFLQLLPLELFIFSKRQMHALRTARQKITDKEKV